VKEKTEGRGKNADMIDGKAIRGKGGKEIKI
jgi:hypothetical protein